MVRGVRVLVVKGSIAFRLVLITLRFLGGVSMTVMAVAMAMTVAMTVSMSMIMSVTMMVVMMTSRVENLVHGEINAQANGGSDHHDPSIDVNGVDEPVDGLVDQPDC